MALPAAEQQKVIAAQRQTLHTLGTPGTWRQAKAPHATVNCVVGMRTVGWRDQELANAYGVDTRIFTLDAAEIAHLEKFDRIEIGNEIYTMDDAIPVYVNGQLIFWKGISKGQ